MEHRLKSDKKRLSILLHSFATQFYTVRNLRADSLKRNLKIICGYIRSDSKMNFPIEIAQYDTGSGISIRIYEEQEISWIRNSAVSELIGTGLSIL